MDQIMKVKDAKPGDFIEVFCYAAGPPYSQYQIATYQPLKNPGLPHDGEPWRKIRAFKGQDVKFLHPLNRCRVLKGKGTFDAIEKVKTYKQYKFGVVSTDFSDPESCGARMWKL